MNFEKVRQDTLQSITKEKGVMKYGKPTCKNVMKLGGPLGYGMDPGGAAVGKRAEAEPAQPRASDMKYFRTFIQEAVETVRVKIP